MDILVLGNGFDLEHELPTKYSDFLMFVTRFLELFQEKEIVCKSQFDSYLLNLCNNQERKEVKLELFELVHNNIWITYFLEKQQELGVNWIDFEKEISNMIQVMEYVISYIKNERDKDKQQIKIPHYVCDNMKRLMPSMEEYISNIEQVLNQKEMLLEDLNKMIRSLEIYLSDYVAKLEIEVYNPDIFKLAPDYVLNFNYTSTYRNLYAKNDDLIGYDYVHGEANFHNTMSTCNMVLGIDEYLQEEERDKNVEFIAFKKYYQRIKKKTGSLHRDWMDEIYLTPLLAISQKMIQENCAYLQMPYSEGDWAYQRYDGSYECDEKTRRFIFEINQLIVSTNDKVLVALQNSDELLECAASIDDEININDFDHAFCKAMNRFQLKQSNTNDIWKKLFYLSENVNRNDLLKYITRKEEQTKDTIELARICYFKEVIQEKEYFENQEEYETEKGR